MLRFPLLWLLPLMTASQLTVHAAELPSESMLARHIEAMGGARAIEAIENIRVQLHISEPGVELRGDYRAIRDGLVRIDIYAGEQRVFSEGIDARGGWQQNGAGSPVEPMSDAGLRALQQGIEHNLYGLFRITERGHRLEALGRLQHEGVNYHVLQLQMVDGFQRLYLLHPETWLIDYSRETSALHPDVNPVEQQLESRHEQYVQRCGVMRSLISRTIYLLSREEVQQSRIIDINCNLGREDLDLARPPGKL
jgi:hypothetical protein